MNQQNILVVDDDEDYVALVTELLKQNGYTVHQAASGREADRQISRGPMDLIIVDGRLPDIDGVRWIQAFRESNPRTPVIFASSLWYRRDEVQHMTDELNVALILHKPLVPSLFCLQVGRILSPEQPTSAATLVQEQMASISSNFEDKLRTRLETVRRGLLKCWEGETEAPAFKETLNMAHQLRGSAGMFGFQAVGLIAGEVEEALHLWRNNGTLPDWLTLMRAVERADKHFKGTAEVSQGIGRGNARRGRLLLLDNDEAILATLSQILEERGYQVVTQRSATHLEPLLDEVSPDLLLLDVGLPGTDGFETCRMVRGLPRWQWLPILLLSLNNDENTRIKAFRAQADDLVGKPIIGEELAARIEVRLERRNMVREYDKAVLDLERSHENLYSILQQLQLGVLIVDKDGKARFISQACRKLLNLAPTQLFTETYDQLLPFDNEALSQLQRQVTLPPQQRTRLQVRVTGATQNDWLEVTVRDDPRQPAGLIFYFNDISELYVLRERVAGRYNRQIVGKSPKMMGMFKVIHQLARGDWTVLIEGETGVGKELVARAIHESSGRCAAPFLAVNCAGLSESLLASQLFGHRRGSFTGAVANQEGLFQAAHGGTLFLDEIGDIPGTVQTSLLRVLQEGEITPLGEVRPRKVDVRIIAATHRTLTSEVTAGNFRRDLFYRLQVGRVKVPPLRERRADIPLLVAHFMERARKDGAEISEIAQDAMARLIEYSWAGNVRELENAVSFASIHARGRVVTSDDIPPEIKAETDTPGYATHTPTPGHPEEGPVPPPPGRFQQDEERNRIVAALQEARGNRSQAARLLDMSRATFYRRLTDLGINAEAH